MMRNEKGMILVVVIMVVMLMSVLVMGMLSRNSSQVISSEDQIKGMQAQLLSRGGWWRAYPNYRNETSPNGFTETLEGVVYNVSYDLIVNNGPGGTDKIETRVTY
jgi:type II secretory pathway component PulK